MSERLRSFHQRCPYFVRTVITFLSPTAASGPRLVSGQGLLGPDSREETQRIHRENQAKLQGMSRSEILQEREKLLSQLGRCFCEPFLPPGGFIDPYGTQLSHRCFFISPIYIFDTQDGTCVVFYPH